MISRDQTLSIMRANASLCSCLLRAVERPSSLLLLRFHRAKGFRRAILAELLRIEIVIISALAQQLLMGTAFLNLSTADDEDPIRRANGGKAVRNDEACTILEDMRDRVLNQLLCFGVDGACCLIEYEDARVFQHHAGKREQLLLSGRKTRATLADLRLISLFLL